MPCFLPWNWTAAEFFLVRNFTAGEEREVLSLKLRLYVFYFVGTLFRGYFISWVLYFVGTLFCGYFISRNVGLVPRRERYYH